MKKSFVATLAVALFIAITQGASAASIVTVTNNGTFGSNNTNTIVFGTGTNQVTLIYNANSPLNIPANSSGEYVLGSFLLFRGSIDPTPTANDTFRLDITQTVDGVPTVVSPAATATVTGFASSGAYAPDPNRAILIDFGGASFNIGNVSYEIMNTPISYNNPLNIPGIGLGFQGSVIARASGGGVTPLPAAAWGGMTLFGLLAGNKLRRRLADA